MVRLISKYWSYNNIGTAVVMINLNAPSSYMAHLRWQHVPVEAP
jgi:hypothetical protein